MAVTEQMVLEALSKVEDPELHRDLVSLGMVKDVAVDSGAVSFRVVLTTPACPLRTQIEQSAREAVASIPGVTLVTVNMDAEVRKSAGGCGHGAQAAQGAPQQAAQPVKAPIEGIKHIVAVASGKGGVGKSTVSVNLALALAKTGAKVGVLDADIYGPNVPIMLGLSGRAPVDNVTKRILPMEAYGLKVMSMGILTREGAPVMWRGPLVGSAVRQLLRDVQWGELDYLVVDLPPGTGDAQMTLCQQIPLAGVVMVTTPQEVSISDVARAVAMFNRVEVPIIGMVENMSSFVCPHCKEETEMFGSHGVQELCKASGLPLLGEIPLDPEVWAGGNGAGPVVATHPSSRSAITLTAVAEQVAAKISQAQFAIAESAEAAYESAVTSSA